MAEAEMREEKHRKKTQEVTKLKDRQQEVQDRQKTGHTGGRESKEEKNKGRAEKKKRQTAIEREKQKFR